MLDQNRGEVAPAESHQLSRTAATPQIYVREKAWALLLLRYAFAVRPSDPNSFDVLRLPHAVRA